MNAEDIVLFALPAGFTLLMIAAYGAIRLYGWWWTR